MQGYSEAPDGSETESGEDDGDGGGGLTANNNAASIQQEQVVCDGSNSVMLTNRPSIERSRRLLPSLRRIRTSRTGGAPCILRLSSDTSSIFYIISSISSRTNQKNQAEERKKKAQAKAAKGERRA